MAEKMFIKGADAVSRFEVKRYGYTLTFEISPDALECLCDYEPTTIGGTPLTEAELQAHLAQFKITEGILPESYAALLKVAANLTSVSGLLLARGVPMIPGEDGEIIIGAGDDSEEMEPDEKTGTVNFRNVQAFVNANEGDLVATIKRPGSGTPGKTVTGNIIPSLLGTPVKFKIGQNVKLGEDGHTIYAIDTGRVCLNDNVISVEDIYEIKGDVNFKVGNITFKGCVEVKGDVLDGFFVKATKGIKIQGNIGACVIESGGNISFCGMSGQGSGSITCGGSLTANFIYDTTIKCAGDILVATEIRSSQIKCLGGITVSKGGIAGGDYIALAGIECGNLGNITSLRTRVVAGVHYGDTEELNSLFLELKSLVADFSAAPKGSIDMKDFAQKRADITERTQAVRSRIYERCNPKINVSKMLYEGVNITLGLINDSIVEARKGPLSILENTVDGGFRFLKMTPLTFKAHMIEQAYVQQNLLENK